MGLTLLIVAVSGYLLLNHGQQDQLDTDPDKGATLVTASLLATTTKLQKSFNTLGSPDNPGQVTRDYIAMMKSMQQDCRDIGRYQTAAKQANAAEVTINHLHTSTQLCDDLSKLAATSDSIYTAALPLLSASRHIKRYQTVPPVTSLVRHRQTAAVAKAIKQLAEPVRSTDYPTQSVVQLKKLQSSIQNQPGLSYYPAITTFQDQLLAERQRYWTDYGDLGALTRTLKIQLDRYCEGLPTEQTPTQACDQ